MEEDIRKKGELCRFCDKRYLTVWRAPDYLWEKMTGIKNGSGLMCPKCFDELARKEGIELYWECREDEFPTRQ